MSFKWLTLFLCSWIAFTSGNVEKVIFKHQPMIQPSAPLDHLLQELEHLSPLRNTLRTALEAPFPSEENQLNDSNAWLLISDLNRDQTYEVRISWCATSPTAFSFRVLQPSEVLKSELLTSSVNSFAANSPKSIALDQQAHGSPSLFLRIFANADYLSSSARLMSRPPQVDVDVVLDPFLFNILPRSLLPHSIFLAGLSLLSWLLSGFFWRSILHPPHQKAKAS